MAKKILVVDDSALVRKQIKALIEDAGYSVDTAKNGLEGLEKAKLFSYDAITMDINMPVMDGVTAVKKIMQTHPTPIIMVSSLTTEDAKITFDAFEFGAIAAVPKPGTFRIGGEEERADILEGLQEAFAVSRKKLSLGKYTHKECVEKKENFAKADSVVLIGASTGGPGLIEEICSVLPTHYPHAICIVQHMPKLFTKNFAQRLDKSSRLTVVESKHNAELLAGHIYIGKGGEQVHFSKKASGKIVIRHGKPKKRRYFAPSVDEMMLSAISVFTPDKILAVLLTGIGDDGANAMVELKKRGVHTLAESEKSACVYGMPKEAYLRGGVCEMLSFSQIVKKIVQG